MRVATWNVNSVRAREARVLDWLDVAKPDVLCMQETKVEDAAFPLEGFRARGYELALHGQRTYNGVAIASRGPITDVTRGFGDDVTDPQARFIVGTTLGIRVASSYLPNGEAVGTDKFTYKLAWIERLRAWLASHVAPDMPFLLVGDFNVAPEPIDVHDPIAWEGQCLFTIEERTALARAIAPTLTDQFRAHHPTTQQFTYWDYRMLAFPKNRGLRIDHAFATPSIARRVTDVRVDREARKGKLPSDHAPLLLDLAAE